MRVHLWPHGLMGQVMAVLLAAIMLEFLGSALLYDYFDVHSAREERARHLAEQLVVADRLITGAPPETRDRVAEQLSSEHFFVKWRSFTIPDQVDRYPALRRVRDTMNLSESALIGREVRLSFAQRDQNVVVGALQLSDGSWLHFRLTAAGGWASLYKASLSILILVMGVLLAAALVIRTLGTPLRSLARAADSIGSGSRVVVTERGSRDLRMVARAFNSMQTRIEKLLASRTQTLAAVSHDLRTPLARLRLRAELITDDAKREAIGRDLEEMERMLDSVLAYLAGETDPEKPCLVDLATTAMTVVDDAIDAGKPVQYSGPDLLHLQVRRLAIKRAIGNLVDNAVKYGDRAMVRLWSSEEGVHLAVEDEGPGIPEEEHDKVIEPFYRLDVARPRSTDGLGLGLAIVHRSMQQEGGALRLTNRAGGGLNAELFFPQMPQDPGRRNTLS